ncbi:MAG: DNRLRE domain-containing protein [Promethearchaeota archaeon]
MWSKIQLLNSNCSIKVIFFFMIIILLFHNCAWATGISSNQQIDIPANADSYVIVGSSTNLGSHVTLDVYNSESEERVVIIRFDVFNLSVNINTCTLRLKTNFVLTPHIVDVYGCTSTTWDEDKIRGSTLPSYEDQILDSQNVNSTSQEFYDWDVTSWVQTHASFGNVTFILLARR